LQLVGRTLEEEAVIKMTEIVDAALVAAKPDSSGVYLPLLERLRAVLRV
jgi:amidase